MTHLKFALVGCGRIANKHIEALKRIKEARLVALCDQVETRAKELAERLAIPYYTNYHDMLQNQEIDVVNILTPSGLHAQQTMDIVENYKKHIVCEKPMALKLEEADQMIEVCQKHQVRLFVVLQNRFNPAVQALKRALDAGRFGRLVLGAVRVRWTREQGYYDADSWRGTWELDGGCLTNQASHHIDLLTWLLGEPVEVTAKTATRLLNIEVEDTGAAIIRFRNGALGIVEATTATRPVNLEGSLSLLGEKGAVEIGGFNANQIKTWQFADETEEDERIRKTSMQIPEETFAHGHQKYLEHVIHSLLYDKPALVDGQEGRKSLELLHAIYESAESGQSIPLRFIPKKSKLGRKL